MSVINILFAIFSMWPFQSGLAIGLLTLVPIGILRRTPAHPLARAAKTSRRDSENHPQTFDESANSGHFPSTFPLRRPTRDSHSQDSATR
jgi:hypothetical protein